MDSTSLNLKRQVLSNDESLRPDNSNDVIGIKIVNSECYIPKSSESEAEAEPYASAQHGKGKKTSIEPIHANIVPMISEVLPEDSSREVVSRGLPIAEPTNDDSSSRKVKYDRESIVAFISDSKRIILEIKKNIESSNKPSKRSVNCSDDELYKIVNISKEDYCRLILLFAETECLFEEVGLLIKKIINNNESICQQTWNTCRIIESLCIHHFQIINFLDDDHVKCVKFRDAIHNFFDVVKGCVATLLCNLGGKFKKNTSESIDIVEYSIDLFSRYAVIFCGLEHHNMLFKNKTMIIYNDLLYCVLVISKMTGSIEARLGKVRCCKSEVLMKQQRFYNALLSLVMISNVLVFNVDIVKNSSLLFRRLTIDCFKFYEYFLTEQSTVYCGYPKQLMRLIYDGNYSVLINSFCVFLIHPDPKNHIVEELFKRIMNYNDSVFSIDFVKTCHFTLSHVEVFVNFFENYSNSFIKKTCMETEKKKIYSVLENIEDNLLLFRKQLMFGEYDKRNIIWRDKLRDMFVNISAALNRATCLIDVSIRNQVVICESNIDVLSKKKKKKNQKSKITHINTVSELNKEGDQKQQKTLPLLPFQSSSLEKKEEVAFTSESLLQVNDNKPESIKEPEGLNSKKSDNRQSKIKQHKADNPLMHKNKKQPLVKNLLVKKELHDKSGSPEIEEDMPLSSEVDITKGARPKIKSSDTLKKNNDKQDSKDSKHLKMFIPSNGKNKKYPIVNTQRFYPETEERMLSSSSMDIPAISKVVSINEVKKSEDVTSYENMDGEWRLQTNKKNRIKTRHQLSQEAPIINEHYKKNRGDPILKTQFCQTLHATVDNNMKPKLIITSRDVGNEEPLLANMCETCVMEKIDGKESGEIIIFENKEIADNVWFIKKPLIQKIKIITDKYSLSHLKNKEEWKKYGDGIKGEQSNALSNDQFIKILCFQLSVPVVYCRTVMGTVDKLDGYVERRDGDSLREKNIIIGANHITNDQQSQKVVLCQRKIIEYHAREYPVNDTTAMNKPMVLSGSCAYIDYIYYFWAEEIEELLEDSNELYASGLNKEDIISTLTPRDVDFILYSKKDYNKIAEGVSDCFKQVFMDEINAQRMKIRINEPESVNYPVSPEIGNVIIYELFDNKNTPCCVVDIQVSSENFTTEPLFEMVKYKHSDTMLYTRPMDDILRSELILINVIPSGVIRNTKAIIRIYTLARLELMNAKLDVASRIELISAVNSLASYYDPFCQLSKDLRKAPLYLIDDDHMLFGARKKSEITQ
ncbi:MAG: hypothetical protein KAG53_01870 [Endozoicomonadaceae bacterium]|nr:hypothetical protein [Endozoicomonadaceae bacterium]